MTLARHGELPHRDGRRDSCFVRPGDPHRHRRHARTGRPRRAAARRHRPTQRPTRAHPRRAGTSRRAGAPDALRTPRSPRSTPTRRRPQVIREFLLEVIGSGDDPRMTGRPTEPEGARRADPTAAQLPAAVPAAAGRRSCCSSSSAPSPRSTCRASTPTSSTRAWPRGDTGYILRTGGVDARGQRCVQIVCSIAAVYFGARAAMGFGRDVRGGDLPPGRRASPPARSPSSARPSLITRTTNDVQQVQMLVLMTCTMLVAAPIMCVGGIIMALRAGRRRCPG